MNVKALIFLFFLARLFQQTPSFCQTLYFNYTIDLQAEWGTGMSVIANDSAYHIAGIAGPGYKICIVETGLNGTVNWLKKFGKSNELWYPGNPGSLCSTPCGGYVLGGSIETSDTIYGTAIRFDDQFDTSFMKRYISHLNYALILTCIKPTFDSGFIFTGEIYVGGYNSDIILLKTDSLGNEQWRTTKNLGGADRGWSIIQTPDSGYVVGGYTYIPGVYHSGNNCNVKFDKNGVFQWSEYAWWSPYTDDKTMVCLNDDSTYTVLTAVADSIYTYDFDYTHICVINFTQDGQEIWRKKYGGSIPGNFIGNIKILTNKGYICVGSQLVIDNDELEFVGWLLRINSNGDSIWFRKYYHSEAGNIFQNNFLRDIDLTSDGGFIATGETYDDYPNDLQRIWILKVDSLGCDTAGCDPTVGVPEEEMGRGGEEERLEVYPNPCTDQIHGRWTMDDGRFNIDWTLVIYDIFGRKALIPDPFPEYSGQTPNQGKGEFLVDVSTLPPGIYLLVLKDGLTVKASAKFVVTR